jgi:5-hydroxyisourate hydrolase
MRRSPITTHVLDLARGVPAAGVLVSLEARQAAGYKLLAEAQTDSDGRASNLIAEESLPAGIYRLTFQIGKYQQAHKTESFYPQVTVDFEVTDGRQHYHVPLLLSPFGYSTYRGS